MSSPLSTSSTLSSPLSVIELSKENLLHNVACFRSILSADVKLGCVVKANAYGHGMAEVVTCIESSVDYFMIDDVDELRRLRAITRLPILLLGYVSESQLTDALALDPIFVVYDPQQVRNIQTAAKQLHCTAKVHIKHDAELGRQGVMLPALPELLTVIEQCDAVKLTGTYAHFANIEDTSDFTHAQKQIDAFAAAQEMLAAHGYTDVDTHIASSSGILAYEQHAKANSIVRLGIGLYGLWPSNELRTVHETEAFTLKPVLRWVTHIAQIKELPTGHSVGYGLSYITSKSTRLAVIPQGYSDGYDRGLSNTGEVLIRGQRCPVIGRISMNVYTVDVSHVPEASIEDEVVLLGTQGDECITAEEIAAKLNTINYEVVARISALLPRTIC